MTLNPADPEQLRARARAVRRSASALGSLDTDGLVVRADESTWCGPTPQRCYDELMALRSTLRSTVDEMIEVARHLEAQADVAAQDGGTARIVLS